MDELREHINHVFKKIEADLYEVRWAEDEYGQEESWLAHSLTNELKDIVNALLNEIEKLKGEQK